MLETGKTYRNSKEVRDDLFILGTAETHANYTAYAVFFVNRDTKVTIVGEIEIDNLDSKNWSEVKES